MRLLLLAALLLPAGCIKSRPVVKLESSAAVAVAFALEYDDRTDVVGAPEEVVVAVNAELARRNLEPAWLGSEGFDSRRTTAQRLASVAERAGEAPYVLLIEVSPSFYSQIQGKFRWTVHTRISVAEAGAVADALGDATRFPAVLDFDRQRHEAAVSRVSGLLATSAGRLCDRLLGGR